MHGKEPGVHAREEAAHGHIWICELFLVYCTPLYSFGFPRAGLQLLPSLMPSCAFSSLPPFSTCTSMTNRFILMCVLDHTVAFRSVSIHGFKCILNHSTS